MAAGYSFPELTISLAIVGIGFGAAVPLAHSMLDRSRTAGAAVYVSGRLALARIEAVKRSAFVAMRFTPTDHGYIVRTYVDGNGNGVLAVDIVRGVDRPVGPEMRLEDQFPGVEFGIHPQTASIDPGETLNYDDPIQIGGSSLLSFNPNGSSTSGTLFIRGKDANQFAVRVLGTTARTRVFHFDFTRRVWRTP